MICARIPINGKVKKITQKNVENIFVNICILPTTILNVKITLRFKGNQFMFSVSAPYVIKETF